MSQDLQTFDRFVQKQSRNLAVTAAVTIGVAALLGLIGYLMYDPRSRSDAPPVLMLLGGMLILVGAGIHVQSLFIKRRCRTLTQSLATDPSLIAKFWVTEITTRTNGIEANRRRELSVLMADGKTLTLPTAVIWSKLGGSVEDKTTPELVNALSRLAPHAAPETDDWVVS